MYVILITRILLTYKGIRTNGLYIIKIHSERTVLMPKSKKSNNKKYTIKHHNESLLKSILSIKVDGKIVYKK